MTLLLRLLIVLCLVGVAGCTKPTPYQSREDGYGFSSVQLEPNRYRVTFYGNTATSRETVETYLLYRAAELTLQVDGDHFQVVERDTETDVSTYGSYTPYYGSSVFFGYGGNSGYYRRPYSGYRYGYGLGYGVPIGTVQSRTTKKFEATVEFLAFRGPKPPDDPMSYDAHEVVANLGPSIRYPTP